MIFNRNQIVRIHGRRAFTHKRNKSRARIPHSVAGTVKAQRQVELFMTDFFSRMLIFSAERLLD